MREGMGEIVFQNGDYYRGQWTNDNMTDGFGKFTCETKQPKFKTTIAVPSKNSTKGYFYLIFRS